MYLLIHSLRSLLLPFKKHLHPTMYLLIQMYPPYSIVSLKIFTSHYVSINSSTQKNISKEGNRFTSHYVSINSNVFALTTCFTITFTSHYVSINSYQGNNKTRYYKKFTSHYVSINSARAADTIESSFEFTSHYVSINSPPGCTSPAPCKTIYIPLCIY